MRKKILFSNNLPIPNISVFIQSYYVSCKDAKFAKGDISVLGVWLGLNFTMLFWNNTSLWVYRIRCTDGVCKPPEDVVFKRYGAERSDKKKLDKNRYKAEVIQKSSF